MVYKLEIDELSAKSLAWRSLGGWLPRLLGRFAGENAVFQQNAVRASLGTVKLTAARLKEAEQILENQFLAMGSSLESMSAVSHEFVKHSESLIRLATGRNESQDSFANALNLIEGALSYFERWSSRTREAIGALRALQTEIQNLLRVEKDLARAMMPLKVAQMMYKVVSAGFSIEVQQQFLTLTQEIEGLHDQVRDVFGCKFAELEAAHHTISCAIESSEARVVALSRLMEARKVEILKTVSSLQEGLAANQERDIRLTALSRQISSEVDKIVMGLQFQDIVHQKFQHLYETVDKIEQTLLAGKLDATSVRFTQVASRIELAQCEAIQKDLTEAETTIRGGVEIILQQLSEADAECLSLEQFTALTTSFDGMAQVLLDSLAEAGDRVGETIESATTICDLLKPVGNVASGLTAVVRRLVVNIHLLGLNAQIQAAHLEEGGGMEVLAARTSDLCKNTNSISESAAEKLDGLVASLQKTMESLQQTREEGVAQRDLICGKGGEEKVRLHGFRDAALALLPIVDHSLQDIRRHGNRVFEVAQPVAICGPCVSALIECLKGLESAAGAAAGPEPESVAPRADVNSLRANYTTASERRAFDIATGVAVGSMDEYRATDRSIELFGEGEQQAPAQIESTQNSEIQKNEATPKPVPAATLGDNIELF